MKQRWTGKKKPVSGEHGYDEAGIKFYENMRKAFSAIPKDEWKEVWGEYWELEKENHFKSRGKKMSAWAEGNEDEEDDEAAVELLSDGSSDEDEEESNGMDEELERVEKHGI